MVATIVIMRIDWPVFSRCSHSTIVVMKSSLQEYGASMWPHLQSQRKAPWGRGCVWHPRKSQEQNALIPAQYWYKLGIRVDTRSHRLNSATSFPGLFPFPGNEVGPSDYQWITPFKEIWIPESGKSLPVESGILSYGIWNTAQRIRNPTNDWSPESKSSGKEFENHLLESLQNSRLSWISIHGVKQSSSQQTVNPS